MAAKFELRSHGRPWGRRWTWILRGDNGEPVAQSEPYSSKAEALEGMRVVRRIAANALGPDVVVGWVERRMATDTRP